ELRALRQRLVEHAARAELLLKALRDLERAPVEADVLPEDEDALVAPHLQPQRVRDRLEGGLLRPQLRLIGGGVSRVRRARRRPRPSRSTGGGRATARRAR